MSETIPHRPIILRYMLIAVAIFSTLTAIYQVFNIGFYTGYSMFDVQYIYVLMSMLLPVVFLAIPASVGTRVARVPWYDWILATTSLACCGFFAANAVNAIHRGWEFAAPEHVIYMSYLMWILVLEAVRRCGGWAIFTVVLLMSCFPLFADWLPDSLAGMSTPIEQVAIYHALSAESILGIPVQAYGKLVIGFLLFGTALQFTGGGKFFLDLAFALLGKVRGGPAKVSIFSSGLMGSMSGSVITNVLTTGPLSIPAMRRVGFSKTYAAGVETCASTGGVLMPPVMGAAAFIMAVFLDVPYGQIALAAAIPSALYFYGLFIQIDFFAARKGLKGLEEKELPKLGETFKAGWHYLFVFALLIWMLLVMNREAVAPFYATALLIVINQVRKTTRWDLKDLLGFIEISGLRLVELLGLMAGIGMIMGGLAVTGMSGTIATDLLFIAGGNPMVLLLMGALTSFILGIGMPITAAYIFLAIALAPALVDAGLNPVAVHMFILYWGMLSFITPPVATGAFTAAKVAGSHPMKTGFMSMQLGSIIYFIPFFFVMEPALLLQGTPGEIIKAVISALIGIALVAGGLQGYLPKLGSLANAGFLQWPVRVLFIVGGLLVAMPHNPLINVPEAGMLALAIGCLTLATLLSFLLRRKCLAAG
ncbi:TRAP transporter fused permease subunit [Halomonas sp. Y3]|uniref:TRAP transporter permease n=1 Tax=Halomonas sp. Y3 TaxID=2956797 RepID=UPI00209C7BA8|nr:TRAP transporter fused permease subunit [Halomonas sp. Y3]